MSECELCGYRTDNRAYMALHEMGCDEAELGALAAVVEAELVLMQHHAERRGCGCPRHRPWVAA